MINYRRSDIFASDAQTLVNTVNCVGVMGKGIAKEFKKRDPEMFRAYKDICDQDLLTPGKLWLWRQRTPWVLNFPTKNHWRGPSKISWIEAGLEKFSNTYKKKGITSIAFPKLGCGNGGLDWDDVRPIMEHFLSPLDIPVYIHGIDVGIVIPEHIANPDESQSRPASFDEFHVKLTKYFASKIDTQRSIVDGLEYEVGLSFSGELAISIDDTSHLISSDDLRGVWLNMQGSPISAIGAEWFNADLRGCFVDVLAKLPFTSASIVEKGEKSYLSVSMASGASQATSVPDQDALI